MIWRGVVTGILVDRDERQFARCSAKNDIPGYPACEADLYLDEYKLHERALLTLGQHIEWHTDRGVGTIKRGQSPRGEFEDFLDQLGGGNTTTNA